MTTINLRTGWIVSALSLLVLVLGLWQFDALCTSYSLAATQEEFEKVLQEKSFQQVSETRFLPLYSERESSVRQMLILASLVREDKFSLAKKATLHPTLATTVEREKAILAQLQSLLEKSLRLKEALQISRKALESTETKRIEVNGIKAEDSPDTTVQNEAEHLSAEVEEALNNVEQNKENLMQLVAQHLREVSSIRAKKSLTGLYVFLHPRLQGLGVRVPTLRLSDS